MIETITISSIDSNFFNNVSILNERINRFIKKVNPIIIKVEKVESDFITEYTITFKRNHL